MLSLAWRKLVRDIKYTGLIVVILTAGLSSWILLPSISEHLQSALYDYSNRIATFVTIAAPIGGPSHIGLPSPLIQQMKAVAGVQSVYAFRESITHFVFYNVPIVYISPTNGTRTVRYENVSAGLASAPMGEGFFPPEVANLVQGRFPAPQEAGFISNCDGPIDPRDGSALTVNSSYNVSLDGEVFNAAVTGRNAINYIYASVCVLWNANFLEAKLGSTNFTATFKGSPNYVIVRVDSINDVQKVVTSLKSLIRDRPEFTTTYDEAALVQLQNLQQASSPLYHLMAWVGLISASASIFFASLLASGRRSWEAALLVSQGLSRTRIFGFVFSFYGLISLIASLAAFMVSEAVAAFEVFKFQVFGSILSISTPPSLFYLISSLPLALLISAIVAILESSRLMFLNLDKALRDY